MRTFLIDTDTAADDALAIVMALYHPDVDIVGITINCGNSPFDQQMENALYTLELAGFGGKVPVYPGCREPLMKLYRSVPEVFGADGMGNSYFPQARQRPEARHAVDAIIELAHRYEGELEVIALAPLTNLAVALSRDPSIARKFKAIYYMGGTLHAIGNVTMGAEYNAWVDPEATRIVFHSGANLMLIPWEVAKNHAFITESERAEIARMETTASRFYMQVTRVLHEYSVSVDKADGVIHADCIGMAIPLDPSIITEKRRMFVDIECGGELSRGVTFLDWVGLANKPANMDVVISNDRERFRDMMFEFLRHR